LAGVQASNITQQAEMRVSMGPDRFSWVNPPRVNVTVQVGCSNGM